MTDPREARAWLERDDTLEVPVMGSCSIGRAANNQLVLADEKVSRRHALIHRQGEDEFWLVDLGSANGSYLNGRRVVQPVALTDGALIQIGASTIRFRMRNEQSNPSGEFHYSARTVPDIRSAACWLLVADIESSTELSRGLPSEQLPIITGRWFANCKQAIEGNGGTINKYLGDGFFAYWPATAVTFDPLVKALHELKMLQSENEPRFRIVLHHGPIFMGGAPSMGEESLSGPEVNFVFRMEKLAGALKRNCLMSEAARTRLGEHVAVLPAGTHALPGFEGSFAFFSF